MESEKILTSRSNYWVQKNGTSYEIGRRNNKEVILVLQGRQAVLMHYLLRRQVKTDAHIEIATPIDRVTRNIMEYANCHMTALLMQGKLDRQIFVNTSEKFASENSCFRTIWCSDDKTNKRKFIDEACHARYMQILRNKEIRHSTTIIGIDPLTNTPIHFDKKGFGYDGPFTISSHDQLISEYPTSHGIYYTEDTSIGYSRFEV